ncbi:bacteriophage-related protein [Stenotrophomonas acidaminiphila]|nr:bacteriophage-related protein [Stenotrophomonas acidaminiphila]
MTTFVPFHFKKRGIKKVIVAPEGVSQPIAVTDTPVLTPEQDRPLLKALGRGIYWQQLIDNGTVASGTEIAERECIHRSTVNDLLRLALLAPDIIQAAYEGRLPRAVSLEAILRAKVPLDWNEQRRLIASLG